VPPGATDYASILSVLDIGGWYAMDKSSMSCLYRRGELGEQTSFRVSIAGKLDSNSVTSSPWLPSEYPPPPPSRSSSPSSTNAALSFEVAN
jgi:hypothetical protein